MTVRPSLDVDRFLRFAGLCGLRLQVLPVDRRLRGEVKVHPHGGGIGVSPVVKEPPKRELEEGVFRLPVVTLRLVVLVVAVALRAAPTGRGSPELVRRDGVKVGGVCRKPYRRLVRGLRVPNVLCEVDTLQERVMLDLVGA